MIGRAILALLLVGLGALAGAQRLLEAQAVAAVSLHLNPGVSLPSGSMRAAGEGTAWLKAQD